MGGSKTAILAQVVYFYFGAVGHITIGGDNSVHIDKWRSVFTEHPEFFLIYSLDGDDKEKAALRWRYTNKLFDSKTGKEYTQQEKEALPKQQQSLLTTKPLTSDAIAALMNTAIELHSRVLEELTSKRWWILLFAATLGFVGALLGAVVAAMLGHAGKGVSSPLNPWLRSACASDRGFGYWIKNSEVSQRARYLSI
jgi:hypothetical protein